MDINYIFKTIPVDLQAVQHAEWILQLTTNQIILQWIQINLL